MKSVPPKDLIRDVIKSFFVLVVRDFDKEFDRFLSQVSIIPIHFYPISLVGN